MQQVSSPDFNQNRRSQKKKSEGGGESTVEEKAAAVAWVYEEVYIVHFITVMLHSAHVTFIM